MQTGSGGKSAGPPRRADITEIEVWTAMSKSVGLSGTFSNAVRFAPRRREENTLPFRFPDFDVNMVRPVRQGFPGHLRKRVDGLLLQQLPLQAIDAFAVRIVISPAKSIEVAACHGETCHRVRQPMRVASSFFHDLPLP